jgi:UDP-N-acetylmuramoyl-tripeptide--D-alanyl-D-alanine ligase
MIEPLWTLQDIAKATGGLCATDGEAYGISIDSRTVRSGDVFLALKGEHQDGHAYVQQAFAKGAVAAIVSDPVENAPEALITVDDTNAALIALGQQARDRTAAQIVGVTGSVGKTGTKEALNAALSRSGATHASERSYNNDIGVPLTLARMPAATQYGVLEMGMNHSGELRALTAQARPDVAVITNVESVHAEFFDSTDDIADAKAEIFEGMPTSGTAILNCDNPYFDRLASAASAAGLSNVLSFGEAEGADIRLLKYFEADDCSTVNADIAGELMTYRIGVPGIHWVKNSLAVLASVHVLGADLGYAGLALGEMVAPKGRGRRHSVSFRDGAVLVIDESYNASPVSMRAAISDLSRAKGPMPDSGIPGRKIAVLGDMLELGDDSVAQHRALANPLQDAGVDLVFTVGAATSALHDALEIFRRGGHAASASELVPALVDQLQPGDVVMLKGSNAMGLGSVVDALVALDDDGSFRRAAVG